MATSSNWNIKGFLDKNEDSLRFVNYPFRVLGDIDGSFIQIEDIFSSSIGDPRINKLMIPLKAKWGSFYSSDLPKYDQRIS